MRDYVDVLEAAAVVRLRRVRRPNGAERIYYAPGPVTLIELAAFVERFPRERPKSALEPVVASSPQSHLPEATSDTPPEATSMEH